MSGKVKGCSKPSSQFLYLRGQLFLQAAVRHLEFASGDCSSSFSAKEQSQDIALLSNPAFCQHPAMGGWPLPLSRFIRKSSFFNICND